MVAVSLVWPGTTKHPVPRPALLAEDVDDGAKPLEVGGEEGFVGLLGHRARQLVPTETVVLAHLRGPEAVHLASGGSGTAYA